MQVQRIHQTNRTRRTRATAAERPLGRLAWLLALAAAAATLIPTLADGQTLRGSRPSVEKMYHFAVRHGIAFRATPEVISTDAAAGKLVPLGGSLDYELTGGVGWPYVTPETKRFVELFAEQFSAVCQMPLVITSASRPLSRQPRNASPQSVHPTGIAIDLRRPPSGPCLDWTRQALVELEKRGVVEATEERRPVHFHVAVLAPRGRAPQLPLLRLAGQDPAARRGAWLAMRESYHAPVGQQVAESEGEETGIRAGLRSVAGRMKMAFARALFLPGRGGDQGLGTQTATLGIPAATVVQVADGDVMPRPRAAGATTGASTAAVSGSTSGATTAATARTRSYRVRQGDTLWDIARRNRTSVDDLLAANGLRRNASIRAGDVLRIPEGQAR
ncbi:MAG TPA: DUF5715 family protein [Gemmatimonadaceae bacterium]|nr:DUF5715 family protein [Gemmatimonadaceae bacterium]